VEGRRDLTVAPDGDRGAVHGERGTEHGDRLRFLAPLRRRAAGIDPVAAPDPVPEVDPVPAGEPLLARFVTAARAAGATVTTTAGDAVPDGIVERWIREHDVRRAVATAAPEVRPVAEAFAAAGVAVAPPSIEAAAAADLGITSASALVASTGSLALRSDVDGRLASLLPPVHLCVAPATRLVPTPGAVLRALGADDVPPGLVLITGTSRTGDIEQILTRRVHGPGTVLIVVTGA